MSSSTVLDLLHHSRACLVEAATATTAGERYAAAHLAALRAAAAVIAARAVPRGGRPGRPRNAWSLLTQVAPDLAEWSAYFAAGAAKRAAAEAGLPHVVSAREADDLLRDVDRFLGLVTMHLGLNPSSVRSGTDTPGVSVPGRTLGRGWAGSAGVAGVAGTGGTGPS